MNPISPFNYGVREQAKALVSGLVAGLTYLQANLPDGITGEEWLGAAIAALLAYSVVFGTPNRTS